MANKFIAVYNRHYAKESEEFDTFQEALRFLEHGSDYNELYAIAIVWNGKLSWVNPYWMTEEKAMKECKEFLT